MAALRLRLAFEYPPPLLPAARLCWLLLPEQCRVVADLESIIRRRFGFSGRTRLHLYLDGGLLPPNESVLLVRDNDAIRVKQEDLTADGFETADPADGLPVKTRKRSRHPSVERQRAQGQSRQRKKRKVAGLSEEQVPNSTGESVSNVSTEHSRKRKEKAEVDGKYNAQKKHCKKKKDKCSKEEESIEPCGARSAASLTSLLGQQHTAFRKRTVRESDGQSSSSDEPVQLVNGALSAPGPFARYQDSSVERKRSVQPRTASPAAAKTDSSVERKRSVQPRTASPAAAKTDSSLSSSSESPEIRQDFPLKPGRPGPAGRSSAPSGHGGSPTTSGSSADSTSGQPVGAETATSRAGGQASPPPASPCPMGNGAFGRGCGRGRGRALVASPQGGAGGWQRHGPLRGRGRGTRLSYNGCASDHDLKPGEQQEAVAGQRENVPKRDYSKLPLLAAPPQVGERIAFKVLELSENYTPELSDYKEGRIRSYDAVSQLVELSVESMATETSKEPGKFDLIYQSENGEDVVEYAVTRGPQLTQNWSSLVEPRLIVNRAEAEVSELDC